MCRVNSPYCAQEERERIYNMITDPATLEAAKLFDWSAYGNDDQKNVGIHRSQFERLYNSVYSRISFESEKTLLISDNAKGDVKTLLSDITKRID